MKSLEKDRLNIYISKDLSNRLEFCANKYGVSRAQLAVILIGQGLAGIEEAFAVTDKLKSSIQNDLNISNNNNNNNS